MEYLRVIEYGLILLAMGFRLTVDVCVFSVCMSVGSHLVSISVPHSSHFMFPCVYVVAMLVLHYVDISICLQFDC